MDIYEGIDGSKYYSVEDIPWDMPILTSFPNYYVTKEGNGYSTKSRIKKENRFLLHGVWVGSMTPSDPNQGRYSFTFWNNGKRTRKSVHVVVLETFLGSRPEGHFPHYIDGNFENNRLDNLIYKIYEPNLRQTLSEEQVLEIASYPREVPHREIAKQYDVGENVICAIRRGRRWKYVLKKHGIALHKDEDFLSRDGFVMEGVNGIVYSLVDDIPDNMPILTDYIGLYVDKRGNCYSSKSGSIKKRVVLYGVSLLPRKYFLNKMGYCFFSYYDRRISNHKNIYIHQLVMQTFVGNCPEGLEIRHLDGNAKNNYLGNLKYGTKSENRIDSIDHKTHNTQKLNEHQVLEILAQPFDVTNVSLAKRYEVGSNTISRIRRGETWKHLHARHGITVVPMDGTKRNGSSRTISDEKRAEICASREHATILAEKYGLHRGTIDKIRREGKKKC